MKIVHVTADIYTLRENSIYRVYIDDDMMTERTVYWSTFKEYVTENMVIQVEEGSTHTIRAETHSRDNWVVIKNITVDGKKSEATFSC